jgi:hypothetical protein
LPEWKWLRKIKDKQLLLQDRDVLRARLETVIARLTEAKAEAASSEEAFRQEIQAQTDLAEIYKSKYNLGQR